MNDTFTNPEILEKARRELELMLSIDTSLKIIVKKDETFQCFDIFPTTHANQHVRMLAFDDMAKVFNEYGIQVHHGYYKISIPYVKALNFLTLHKIKTGF